MLVRNRLYIILDVKSNINLNHYRYNNILQDNLAMFWCVCTSQYFVFDVLLRYKYSYKIPYTKVGASFFLR